MKNQVNTDNNQLVEAIIQAYFQVSEIPTEKLDNHADTLVKLIISAFKNELKSNQALSLPYKDITDVVFYSEHRLFSDSIDHFRHNVEKSISKHYHTESADRHHNTQKKYVKRFMHVYDKLVEHTRLAQAQRDFIEHTVSNIRDVTTTETQDIVSKLQITAQNANSTAENANLTAQKAEETYNSMFANYVTILGIFTAIIVTIFGGLNVVKVVVDNEFELNTLVISVSILFLCLTTLLYFLAHIIAWITGNRKNSLFKIFIGIVFFYGIALVIGLYTYPRY